MSADLLREAAAKMRERAEAATQGEWSNRRGPGEHVVAAAPVGPALVATTETREDRRHIASWHPAVALTVAEWLEETAADMDALMTYGGHGPALAVARAYLGGDS